jgi:transaldolase
MNSIERLSDLGQSVWLDYLDHALITSGEFARLIASGVTGLTSNPTIFEKSIRTSSDYDDIIGPGSGGDEGRVFESIEVREIVSACDLLRPVFERTHGADGFASIEVAPELAHDAKATIEEARRLWRRVGRPNVMIKIPGTEEGLAAVGRSLTEGININVTLLFSVERYERVVEAFIRALEIRAHGGKPIDGIASVASFFVSRIDTKVDAMLGRAGAPVEMYGCTAIANAKVAYERAERIFGSARWSTLAMGGAKRQRLLWASTSPKNPNYRDLHYVEALAGPATIDTMPKETLHALIEHGRPEPELVRGTAEAHAHLDALPRYGVDLAAVTTELETEGIHKFARSYDEALAEIAKKRPAEGDFGSDAQAKRTEFGDDASTRAATGQGLERIP